MPAHTDRVSPPKIAIFDSGLGGISIYDAIRRHFPYASLNYLSDNEAFPYGTKSENELVDRVSRVLRQLDQVFHPDLLVVACNTASTVALPKIRSLIKQPVIGVVPAIKPAAALAQTPCIGLLATPATVQRPYTQGLIDQFASEFQWIMVGSSDLVALAEQKMYGQAPSPAAISLAVSTFVDYTPAQLDTIVLGCTHFPLLKKELSTALPHVKFWVDSSEAIANRVGFWLHELGLNKDTGRTSESKNTIVFTRQHQNEKMLEPLLAERSFDSIIHLSIPIKKAITTAQS